jgi:hypothetical protein
MYQMCILTNGLFSDAQVEKFGIRKKMLDCKELNPPLPSGYHEVEPNPSKDRAMHEGDELILRWI